MIVSRSFKTIPFKCSSIWVKGVCHCLLPFISLALTKDEIKAQAFLFFAAGYDTTANALCWLIYNLAWNPDIQEKVYDEIKSVICENVSLLNYLYLCPFIIFLCQEEQEWQTCILCHIFYISLVFESNSSILSGKSRLWKIAPTPLFRYVRPGNPEDLSVSGKVTFIKDFVLCRSCSVLLIRTYNHQT